VLKLLINAIVQDEPINSVLQNLASRNYKHPPCIVWYQSIFQHLEPFRHADGES